MNRDLDFTVLFPLSTPHQCGICNTTADDYNYLKKHYKNAHNIKISLLFSCRQCAEQFRTVKAVKTHCSKRHPELSQDPRLAGPRPFRCSDCGQAYVTNLSLGQHRRNCRGPRLQSQPSDASRSSALSLFFHFALLSGIIFHIFPKRINILFLF